LKGAAKTLNRFSSFSANRLEQLKQARGMRTTDGTQLKLGVLGVKEMWSA